MKEFRNFTLSDKEWEFVKRCYLKFYKKEHKCTSRCPMGFDTKNKKLSKTDMGLFCEINRKRGWYFDATCICHQFEEFKDIRSGCPCNVLKEKAFIQLEKFIKRECFK